MNSAECDEMPKDLRKKLEAEGIDPEMVICWRKIMKIFISMPMNGKTDEQIRKDFEEKKKYLKEQWGFNPEMVIDSIIGDGTTNLVKYLAKSIDLMADADLVFFASGWERARGCKIEHEVAIAYGKVALYEQ